LAVSELKKGRVAAIPAGAYVLTTCAPGDLTDADLKTCVSLVSHGGAVPRRFAEPGLRDARLLAVVRRGADIVAVGAIKRVRHDYAARRAKLSGFRFPTGTPELGYVARSPAHSGNGFAPRIVQALVSVHAGPLWATTDSAGMKDVLGKAGFLRKGSEWPGARGQLSLWLKER
jgi:hypothetical protein